MSVYNVGPGPEPTTPSTTRAQRIIDGMLNAGRDFTRDPLSRGMDGMAEVRKTSDTGGQKGQKSNRQDLISARFLTELGEVCGMGAEKYDDDNWRKGYSWRLSYGALQRHVQAFWLGEDNDPESGLHHLAHVAWHCMVMFTYSTDMSTYGRFDDRPDKDVSTLEKAVQAAMVAPEEYWANRTDEAAAHGEVFPT